MPTYKKENTKYGNRFITQLLVQCQTNFEIFSRQLVKL